MPEAAEAPGADLRIEVLSHLTDDEVAGVGVLVERATEVDGVRPLSEHVALHLRYGGDERARHVLVWVDDTGRDRLVGYGHLDVTDAVEGASAEVAVDPSYRRHGVGRLLVGQLVAESPAGPVRLWAHGEASGAGPLARSMGFVRARVLWQMRRSLFAPLPRRALPDGISLRSFRPGEDDEAWVALNARAFAALPDQGSWTLDDLHRRMAESWFDAAGFLVATDADGTMVGFHWTKVHGHVHDAALGPHTHEHGHEPIGEVYVVGVDPSYQGHGLGRTLTIAGLQFLRGRGLGQAMLYVDATNTAAIAVYERLGFTRWDTDVLYRRDQGGPHLA